jgi:hypothetical protein
MRSIEFGEAKPGCCPRGPLPGTDTYALHRRQVDYEPAGTDDLPASTGGHEKIVWIEARPLWCGWLFDPLAETNKIAEGIDYTRLEPSPRHRLETGLHVRVVL